jgi:hypothetical protein
MSLGVAHMEPDPLDLPTSPTVSPVPPLLPPWPDDSGNRPPRGRPPWPLLTAIGGGVAVVLLIALLFSLLSASGGTTTTLLGATSEQTATTSALATYTAEGTPAATKTTHGTATPTHGTPTPHGTPTATPPPSIEILTKQQAVSSGTGPVVSCPSGELALSGGWSIATRTVPIYLSHRSGNGWYVSPYPSSGTQVTAYVVCLQHLIGATITEREAVTTVPAHGSGEAAATCNPGELLVGGGIANHASGNALILMQSVESKFDVQMRNDSGTQTQFEADAECLTATGAKGVFGSASRADISHGLDLRATCPSGSLVTGGTIGTGNLTASATVLVSNYAPINSTTWQAQGLNVGTSGTTASLAALCLSFS